MIRAQRSLTKTNLFLVAALALSGSLLARSGAQGSRSPEYQQISTAQKFLQALHPELLNHNYLMNVAMTGGFDVVWMGSSRFDVTIESTKSRKSGQQFYEEPMLNASFEFDRSGVFSTVHIGSANGSLEVKSRGC